MSYRQCGKASSLRGFGLNLRRCAVAAALGAVAVAAAGMPASNMPLQQVRSQ